MNNPEAAQNRALSLLLSLPDLHQAKLLGGTALARVYLKHRVSYDLDFFLPEGFDPHALAISMKSAGIQAKPSDIVKDTLRANQWHGFLSLPEGLLKVSFVEDSYYNVFPVAETQMGGVQIQTESLIGLYHRKLLTISQPSYDGKTATGGRQTARDLFDLWVLSKSVMPLRDLIKTLPYDYPEDPFVDGLDGMPWFDLAADLSAIPASDPWKEGLDIGVIRRDLYAQFDLDFDTSGDGEDGSPPSEGSLLKKTLRP